MWQSSVLIILCGIPLIESMRNNTGESRLFNDIIWDNNPYERPLFNKSESVTVGFDFNLQSISHFIEAQQQLVCTGWFIMSWKDEFLTWDPKLYDETEFIRPPSKYVWTPDVVAANSFRQMDSLGSAFVSLKVYSSGHVEWVPSDLFSIPCDVNIQSYPFDSLACYLELSIWSHSSTEVHLEPMKTSAGIDRFKSSGQWSLLSTTVKQNHIMANNQSVSRVIITMLLDRAPTNFVFSFILPVLILSLLGTFVFLIPSDSGEKISFAITIPLSYGVYMGFLTTLVPQTSQGISIFVVFLGVTLVLSAIFVILSIFSVRVSCRKSSQSIPSTFQKLTLFAETVKTCWRRKQVGDVSISDDASPSETAKNLPEPMTWKRVSKALDLLFFWTFCLPLVLSIPSLFMYVFLN